MFTSTMPPKSIYLPEGMIQKIQEQLDDSQSFSEWVQLAVERELEAEHDELEALSEQVDRLTKEVQELQHWRTETMEDIVEWYTGDFGPLG